MRGIVQLIDARSMVELFMDESIDHVENKTYDLIFVLEGKIQIKSRAKELFMSSDDVLVINKNDGYEIRRNSEKNLFLILQISDSLLTGVINTKNLYFNCNSLDSMDQTYDLVRRYLHQIVQLVLIQEEKAKFLQYSYVFKLLNEIITNFAVISNDSMSDRRESQIVEYIYEHYYDSLTLESISKQFYMDASYFSKYFKKMVGVNFKDFLTTIRLNFAQRDLIETDNSIARIAIDNGFTNVNSFYQAFKKNFGETPSHYRETKMVQPLPKEDYSELVKRYQESLAVMNYEVETSQDHSFTIDMTKKYDKISTPWNLVINVGDAQGLLGETMQRQMNMFRNHTSFKYVRFWYLFSEEMFSDWSNGIITNYDKVDQVFDFLREKEFKPWIQLNKLKEMEHEKQHIDNSLDKWLAILTDFLQHIVNRYGRKFLNDWKLEFTLNNQNDTNELEQFLIFVKETKKIVLRINSTIEVGGAGFRIGKKRDTIQQLLEKIHTSDSDLDFYSFVMYPYVRMVEREKRNEQRISDQDFLLHRVSYINELMQNYPTKKAYISEWNNTVSRHNLINDTLYKGAYIIKNIIDVYDKIEGIAYWTAFDLNQPTHEETAILSGGTGVISRHGFIKPALTAFHFLENLKESELIFRNQNIIVGEIDEDEFMIIGHNYQHPNQIYFLKDESGIVPRDVQTFFPKEKNKFIFQLNNLRIGDKYEVRYYYCNSEAGDIFQRWKELDFLNEMRPSDIQYLMECNSLGLSLKEMVVEGSCLKLEYMLEGNQFFAINILKKTNFV